MSISMREAFVKYSGAMALAEMHRPNGDIAVGSAFHLGDGIFATAGHVVDGAAEVRLMQQDGAELTVTEVHSSATADVAVIQTSDETPPETVVPLGSHLDDWINDEAFYLAPVLIMGYPPIPRSGDPRLVAVTGEVNAVIDRYDTRNPHFIVSPLPRGGFSGGPAILGWDFCLGVVCQDLRTDVVAEPGFTAVVSVEPLWQLLDDTGLKPREQDAFDDPKA